MLSKCPKWLKHKLKQLLLPWLSLYSLNGHAYLQCILLNFDDEYVPIQDAGALYIQSRALPVPGMGVYNPVETAEVIFATSRAGTTNIVDAIKGYKHNVHTRFFSRTMRTS